jgi:hypothetical protein
VLLLLLLLQLSCISSSASVTGTSSSATASSRVKLQWLIFIQFTLDDSYHIRDLNQAGSVCYAKASSTRFIRCFNLGYDTSADNSTLRNLRQHTKVEYKDIQGIQDIGTIFKGTSINEF